MSICAVYRRMPADVLEKMIDQESTSDGGFSSLKGNRTLDLDKSWDAVHLFLTGEKDTSEDNPLSLAITGKLIDDIDSDGEIDVEELMNANYALSPEEVKVVAKALAALDFKACEERMRGFDEETLEEMDLYSFDLDDIDTMVLEASALAEQLRDFYKEAAENHDAVQVSMG